MSALLVIPFLESLGLSSFFAGATTEVLGTTLGTTVAESATGLIGAEIGKKIDDLIPEEVKNKPKRIFSDIEAAAMSLYSKDPRYLIENKRRQQEQEQRKQQNTNTTLLNNPYTEETRNDVRRTNLEIYKNLYNQLSTETEIEFLQTNDEVPPNPLDGTVLSENNEIIEQDSDYFQKRVYEEAYDKYQYSPRDIARYLIDFSRDLAITRNPTESIKNILEMNPSFFGLSKRITTYLSNKSLPNTEEFRKISQVYNFEGINYENFQISRNEKGLIVVSFTDETGAVENLEQNTGLILPSVSADLVFMGPFSRNNDLPNRFRLEDWCSMSHDYSYAIDGYFSRNGDLKFISRLSSCLRSGKILPENVQLVESTIIYFSNISLSVGAFLNGSPPEPNENSKYVDRTFNVQTEPTSSNDIFSEFGSPQALDMPPVENYQYVSLRNDFYEIMRKEMEEHNKTDGYMSYARSNTVENEIENLVVQLN